MGHEIKHQVSFGNCHLSQCSCGRGALKVKDKVILLSSLEVAEMSKVFAGDIQPAVAKSSLANKLSRLIGGAWGDFVPTYN